MIKFPHHYHYVYAYDSDPHSYPYPHLHPLPSPQSHSPLPLLLLVLQRPSRQNHRFWVVAAGLSPISKKHHSFTSGLTSKASWLRIFRLGSVPQSLQFVGQNMHMPVA